MTDSVRIRFIRNFTVEPIEFWLKRELHLSELTAACLYGGFASAACDIEAMGRPQGATDTEDLTVLALGLEMTAKDFGHLSWAAEDACENHLMLVRNAIDKSLTPLVINTVLPPMYSATGLAVIPAVRSHGELVDELNWEIRKLAAQQPGKVAIVDWAGFARELGEKGTYDYRFWYSSGAPFATPFLTRYASGIASVVRTLTGKGRKCLVLDCDNTLWGGVVGEDGRQGIRLSSDTLPGAYFQTFQRSVIDLHKRGVAIVLCSKNNESDVLDVLDNHPDCLIRREHLATWRINWNDKARSLAEIAEEMNIGRNALVFIDDSPHECALIRSAFPEIMTIQTPESHEDLVHFLNRRNLFDGLVVTEADIRRTKSYQQNSARAMLSRVVPDLSEYKRQLGTIITVRVASASHVQRVSQLLQRTNQFNLTTRRHDQATVERMLGDPDTRIFCCELEDRFGQLGLIGVLIAQRAGYAVHMDSMLMSCRALGRDAELAFASVAFDSLGKIWGTQRITAEYLPSPKNEQAADFWQRMGLVPSKDTVEQGGRVVYASDADLAYLAKTAMPSNITVMDLTNGRQTPKDHL